MDPQTMMMLAQMFGNSGGGQGGQGGQGSQGFGSFGGGGGSRFGNAIGTGLGYLFTDPTKSFEKAGKSYRPWMNQATERFNPFYQGGVQGMDNLQDWLSSQKDPSQFINNLMGQYQESPYAKNMQDYARRAGLSAASASGLIGSTPFLEQSQQNAANISSQDMQNWLSNVLGINTQYGAGQQNLMNQGFNAAQGQADLFNRRAESEAQLAYNKEQARQNQRGGLFSWLGSLF